MLEASKETNEFEEIRGFDIREKPALAGGDIGLQRQNTSAEPLRAFQVLLQWSL
jgi:hypothetical protein